MLSCQNLLLEDEISTIFKNVSFTALPSSLVVVQGANGSGKTSLLRMITGRIKSSVGTVKWNKIDIHLDLPSFHTNVTYIGHKNALKPELTVQENLEFWAKLNGVEEFSPAALQYFELSNMRDTLVGMLSEGWKRRVELTKLLISPASLWVLDEPETSLDKHAKALLINLLQIKLQNRAIAIIASHDSYKDVVGVSYLELNNFAGI